MKYSPFFSDISNGIIEKDFYFEVSNYIFTIHTSNISDAYYNPPIIESSNIEGECIIYYWEDKKTLTADIAIPNFDYNNFPPELVSVITSQDCRIEKDRKDKFWTISIPFKDMGNFPNISYQMDLMFEKDKLISIIFIETSFDNLGGGKMKSLQLNGELRKGINV